MQYDGEGPINFHGVSASPVQIRTAPHLPARQALPIRAVGDPGDDISTVAYGVIGTSEGVRRFTSRADRVRRYIDVSTPDPRSRALEPQHVPFPGFPEAFHAEWPTRARSTIADLDGAELERVLRIENRHETIRSAVILSSSGRENPVARKTVLYTGRNRALLRTSGYVPRLDTYMGLETPNPILFASCAVIASSSPC